MKSDITFHSGVPGQQQLLDRCQRLQQECDSLRSAQDRTYHDLAATFHELRTPITNIIGFSETLQSGIVSNDPVKTNRFLGIIADQATRMAKLLSDIQLITELESGYRQIIPEPLDLESAVNRAVNAVHQLFPEQPHIIRHSNCAGVCISADSFLFHQLLVSLFHNAVMFTPESGEITLQCQRADNRIDLAITDTGIGISEQDHQRIFERFYRVDVSKSRQFGGNGLGLSLARLIAHVHGCEVSVSSRPGAGATFTITAIPL